jgi:hypothetical protein
VPCAPGYSEEFGICTDDEDGERIKGRLESGFMVLTGLQALDVELSHIESGRSRNSWKRLLVVAPVEPPRSACDTGGKALLPGTCPLIRGLLCA